MLCKLQAVGSVITVGLLTIAAPPTEAAVFSVGPPSGSYVNEDVCMDVQGNSLGISGGLPVPVIAFNCHAGPNQQFQFAGTKIYAMAAQRCVGVQIDLTHAFYPVVSEPCGSPGSTEDFFYSNGMIMTVEKLPGPPPSGTLERMCFDAGSLQNYTQLIAAPCSGSNSQQWQIK